jgi:hypothetical protein
MRIIMGIILVIGVILVLFTILGSIIILLMWGKYGLMMMIIPIPIFIFGCILIISYVIWSARMKLKANKQIELAEKLENIRIKFRTNTKASNNAKNNR